MTTASQLKQHTRFQAEHGWRGEFTREQATGAFPNGTRVVKAKSDAKDRTPTGTPGVVLGSVNCSEDQRGPIMYFIAWACAPRVAVACLARKLRRAE